MEWKGIIHDMIQALLPLLSPKALFVAWTAAVALTAVQAVGLMVEVTEPVYIRAYRRYKVADIILTVLLIAVSTALSVSLYQLMQAGAYAVANYQY
jgi:Na+-translocating ferredoxin:NAD+ oxidoreductase RnfD subunit